jgi:hypothetical protein
MAYKVAKLVKGNNGDFIRVLPDGSGAPGVEIHSVSAAIV